MKKKTIIIIASILLFGLFLALTNPNKETFIKYTLRTASGNKRSKEETELVYKQLKEYGYIAAMLDATKENDYVFFSTYENNKEYITDKDSDFLFIGIGGFFIKIKGV